MNGLHLRILAAEGGHNSFYGNKDELIWGTASFLIILVLFIWKGVPAVKKMAAARTQRIADEIAAGEANKAGAEAELASLKASLGNAAADAEAIIAEARSRVDTVKVDLLARVEADVEASKQRTRIEIEASKQQAFADLQAEVAAMTVTSAPSCQPNSSPPASVITRPPGSDNATTAI